ncbi:unnamed protein product [Rhizophagus irregularis]|nr:unnamed protein product [Rhizophagus irregularis]CAB5364796.1 unnamed protein product [Rhizophagus irregularis]
MSARVLKKEKTSVDKALTKKQAERSGGNRFEETSSHGITTEYFDIDFRGFHDSCSSTSDPSSKPNLEEDIESEYYDFRKRYFESHNLSNEFWNFQQLTIQQIKKSHIYVIKRTLNIYAYKI